MIADAPATIGSYRILGLLGSGGMGVVYRAEHAVTGQRAVIKKLWPRFNDETSVARFFQEARIAASIDDPGIVKVFDFGALPDGSHYLAMELLTGETLAARLAREGRLPVVQAVALLRQAARIVGRAHAQGVVHRDLKPDNLFLVPDPEVPGGVRVKVLDFGIAKLAEQGVDLTGTGATMGTPPYMSPEQWRNAGRVDARTDVYALGCILFEMVTGQLPFPGPGQTEFSDQHRFQAPPAPSAIQPGLPAFLDSAVERALAKSQDDRPASTAELAAMLGEPLASPQPPLFPGDVSPHEPTVITPAVVTNVLTVQEWPARRRVVTFAAAGAVLAAGAVWLAASRASPVADDPPLPAVRFDPLAAARAKEKRHDYPGAVKNLEEARAAGAAESDLARLNDLRFEAANQQLYEQLQAAIAAQDFETAERALEAADGHTWFGALAAQRAPLVNARYIDLHLGAAARLREKDAAACLRDARLVLRVDPANAEAAALQKVCAPRALKSAATDEQAEQRLEQASAQVVQRELDAAAASFEAALALQPSPAVRGRAYRGLGVLRSLQGDKAAAARYFKLYLPLCESPSDREAVTALVARLDRGE